MKKLLILSALAFCQVTTWAQQPETATIMVHYKFSNVRDTNNRAIPYTENMVLFVGKSAGAYRSWDRQLENKLFKKQVQEAMANSPDGNVRINRQVKGSGTVYFQFPNDKKMVRREDLFGNYIIDEQLPVLDWKITGDTASFGELHCQKATTHFKGRDYIAWFCPDLPVRVGPWKLNGLPGVIVDAHDTRGDVVFKFDGVEKVAPLPPAPARPPGGPKADVVRDGRKSDVAQRGPTGDIAPDGAGHPRMMLIGMDDIDDDPSQIQVPVDGTETTDAEFKHMQETWRKHPDAVAHMLNATQGGDGPGGNGPKREIKIKAGPSPVNNNPIEMSDN